MTLSEYLRAAELTHSAFADKIGVSQVTVHRWVNGKRFPDRDTIIRIEELTGCMVKPADWFKPITPERLDALLIASGGRITDAPAPTSEAAK